MDFDKNELLILSNALYAMRDEIYKVCMKYGLPLDELEKTDKLLKKLNDLSIKKTY